MQPNDLVHNDLVQHDDGRLASVEMLPNQAGTFCLFVLWPASFSYYVGRNVPLKVAELPDGWRKVGSPGQRLVVESPIFQEGDYVQNKDGSAGLVAMDRVFWSEITDRGVTHHNTDYKDFSGWHKARIVEESQ